MQPAILSNLRNLFGDQLQEHAPLARYTSARIGGPADALIIARSANELAYTVQQLWGLDLPIIVLGGGCNVLVSDQGVRGVVIINQARLVQFNKDSERPICLAESGATLNDLAQRAAQNGLSGLEWASNIPGSLGGAIYGNAGAFGGEMASNLVRVNILHRQEGAKTWPVERMQYSYRSSVLKRQPQPVVILSAELALEHGKPERIKEKMERFAAKRKNTQPPGASMGSMFKNPPGDYAGRLIGAAGLKGKRIGNAEISTKHANFFINHGATKATDILALIHLARQTVEDRFGTRLELEIELVGEWEDQSGRQG